MELDMSRIGLLTIGTIFITTNIRESKADYNSSEEVNSTSRKFTYGTTFNYPAKEAVVAKQKEKTPEGIYRGILERSINLFWGQQEQLMEIKVLERRIRKKTQANPQEFFKVVQDTEKYIRHQLDGLADKFWNPKEDHPPPMGVESVKYFEDVWNKFEKYLNSELLKLNGIETELDEIKHFIKKGREELPVRFEDIEKWMKNLVIARREFQNYTTTEGTTCSEFVVKLQSLRRNDTRRGSIQR